MVVDYMHKVNADGVIQACAKSTYGIVDSFTNVKMKCHWADVREKEKTIYERSDMVMLFVGAVVGKTIGSENETNMEAAQTRLPDVSLKAH